MTDYQKWEEFLASELKEISENKTLYGEAGDILSSTFQTGEYWVQVNIELVAVYGSIYGILISFSLCSLVVALLAHNWRIVLSMFLTIMSILFSLLGIFRVLGWTLGIVEAVSLSILVGNALDYCIHLSEGYMAVDNRHLAFVERFKVHVHSCSLVVDLSVARFSLVVVKISVAPVCTHVCVFGIILCVSFSFSLPPPYMLTVHSRCLHASQKGDGLNILHWCFHHQFGRHNDRSHHSSPWYVDSTLYAIRFHSTH